MKHDSEIREMLHQELLEKRSETGLIVHELGLCAGQAIADVVWIEKDYHCFEIKSESDTLVRLKNQIQFYEKVFDTITMVVANKHVEHVKEMVPAHWGIYVATEEGFVIDREATKNPNQEAYEFVQFLWREEATTFLKEKSVQRGYVGKARDIIWKRIVEHIPLAEIKVRVKRAMIEREKWKKTGKEENILKGTYKNRKARKRKPRK